MLESALKASPYARFRAQRGYRQIPGRVGIYEYTPQALRPGGRTTTIVPSFTRSTRSMTSSLVMRMQPDEMA